MARTRQRKSQRGQLRIIAGRWRGRKLFFTEQEGLRPTTDRVRETLFNWLTPHLQDARCADLFAGSGALGLEALSRGASTCDFVDSQPGATDQIRQHLEDLEADSIGICKTDEAQSYLQTVTRPYDIVFLDPPFAHAQVAPVCALLQDKSLLAEGALVYIETSAAQPPPTVPPTWTLHRDKQAGEVAYRLYQSGQ